MVLTGNVRRICSMLLAILAVGICVGVVPAVAFAQVEQAGVGEMDVYSSPGDNKEFTKSKNIVVELAGFSVDDSCYVVNALISEGSTSKPLAVTGTLSYVKYDDGSEYLYGINNSFDAGFDVMRVQINLSSGMLDLTFREDMSEQIVWAQGKISDESSLQIESLIEHEVICRMNDSDAIKYMSPIPSMGATASENGSESVEIGAGPSAKPLALTSYSSYLSMMNDVRSGTRSFSLSKYGISSSLFGVSGWHADQANPFNGGFLFKTLVVANGGSEYLVQTVLCEMPALGGFDSYSKYEASIGFGIVYKGGFIAAYDKSSGQVSIRFADVGLGVKNAKIAIGKLPRTAAFTDQMGNIVASSSNVTLYDAVISPSTVIQSAFDYLTRRSSGTTSVQRIYGSYADQAARGVICRNVSISTTGILNTATSNSGPHQLVLQANMERNSTASVTVSCEWSCDFTASI